MKKAGIITAAVEALTAAYDHLPAGVEARAEEHMIEQAQAFDVPQAQRSGRRSCPSAAPTHGRTEADHGISFCPPHHRMADQPQTWNMRQLPDGSFRFTRRT